MYLTPEDFLKIFKFKKSIIPKKIKKIGNLFFSENNLDITIGYLFFIR